MDQISYDLSLHICGLGMVANSWGVLPSELQNRLEDIITADYIGVSVRDVQDSLDTLNPYLELLPSYDYIDANAFELLLKKGVVDDFQGYLELNIPYRLQVMIRLCMSVIDEIIADMDERTENY